MWKVLTWQARPLHRNEWRTRIILVDWFFLPQLQTAVLPSLKCVPGSLTANSSPGMLQDLNMSRHSLVPCRQTPCLLFVVSNKCYPACLRCTQCLLVIFQSYSIYPQEGTLQQRLEVINFLLTSWIQRKFQIQGVPKKVGFTAFITSSKSHFFWDTL